MAAAERLGEVADQLDAVRFVGRARPLELVGDALAGRSHLRIFHVHGPGGVGKSALLRAIERHAGTGQHPIVHLDGRLISPTPDALAADVARADADGSLLIVDEADELLRRAIERTYLDPDGGHGIAQRELHMSRSSFYRHLQKARQQFLDRSAPTAS